MRMKLLRNFGYGFLVFLLGFQGTPWAVEVDLLGSDPNSGVRPQNEDSLSKADVALEALIEKVSEENSAIHEAKAKWEAAKKRKLQSWALPDPMVGMEVMGEMRETHVGPEENTLMVEQEIPFPLKLWKRRQAAGEKAKIAYENYQAVKRDVLYRLKQTYYELYGAEASMSVIEEIHTILKKFEGVAQSRYADRSASQRDVAKAQAEVSMTLEQRYMLEQQRESLAAQISSLLHRDPMLAFGKTVKPEKPPLHQTYAEILTLAAKHRQELKGAEAMVKEARHEKSLAWMENIPDLKAGFNYNWVGSGMTTDREDGKNSWMFPLAINVPIWQQKNVAAILEAKKEVEAAEAGLTHMKHDTFYEVKDAYLRFQTASKIVTLYETAVLPQSELALTSDQAGYEAGRVDFLNLIDSQRVFLNAKLGSIRIYTELLKSFADLERAVGIDLTEEKS